MTYPHSSNGIALPGDLFATSAKWTSDRFHRGLFSASGNLLQPAVVAQDLLLRIAMSVQKA